MIKIAVVSDLHVFNGSSSAGGPSFIGTADTQDSPEKHPFRGIQKLIADEGLSADFLICPGDLADRADPAALMFAWEKLQRLKTQLGAQNLFATSGNHDVDSRNAHGDIDPKGNLQALDPMFPGLSEQQCDKYWSRNFAVFTEENLRIVLLNSAAFHGYGTDASPEYKYGRVSSKTISALRAALATDHRRVNILVCHHHPAPYNPVEEEDYSEMLGGDRLIELLDSGAYGSWILIHGHKHFPRLAYATGSSSSPVIFSAGSFSVALHHSQSARARNQFYILEIPVGDLDSLGLDVAGTITAWDWITLMGWQPAGNSSGLPHIVGFGCREAVRSIARDIASHLPTQTSVLSGEEIIGALPRLRFLHPQDLQAVISRLRQDHQIVMRMQDGKIIEAGRK